MTAALSEGLTFLSQSRTGSFLAFFPKEQRNGKNVETLVSTSVSEEPTEILK